ncbi:hypothetical protein NQZ79_g2234 [Umbelopsis isabellina]|nr:hypothetical protein NQZ79_g2234 [Umbelopsis isabellina]
MRSDISSKLPHLAFMSIPLSDPEVLYWKPDTVDRASHPESWYFGINHESHTHCSIYRNSWIRRLSVRADIKNNYGGRLGMSSLDQAADHIHKLCCYHLSHAFLYSLYLCYLVDLVGYWKRLNWANSLVSRLHQMP